MNSRLPDHAGFAQVGREGRTDPSSVRASVAIGFGSPASDSGVTRLDLNDVLVRHAQATFLMRASGTSMRELGIDSGDLLLIDRAISPVHGHVVIAVVGEEFLCRRLFRQGQRLRLQATQEGIADIVPGEGLEVQLWGVVTQVIKAMPA